MGIGSKLLRITLLIVFCSLFQTVSHANNEFEIKHGILDLRGNKLKDFQEVSFKGEWEFYWEKFLSASDFSDSLLPQLTSYAMIPSIWKDIEVDGEKLPAHGFGTYRIKVLTDSVGLKLALRIGSISSASKVYIDNELLFEAGKIGASKEDVEPGFTSGVKLFTTKAKEFNLIVQVSNYHYTKGGLWSNINSIGFAEYVLEDWESKLGIRLFMLGSILIIAIYFFGIYMLNRQNKSSLFFSIFCLDIGIRSVLLEELFILKLFPNFSWHLMVSLEYLTLPVGALFFILFIYDLLPYASKLSIRIIVGSNLLVVLSIVFLSVNSFTSMLLLFQGVLLVSSGFAVFLVVRGLIKKDRIAVVLFIALLVFMLTIINDILYVGKVINTFFMTTYGFMFFILMQAYLLSYRFLRLFDETQKMARNLEALNQNLEIKVQERTAEIQEANNVLVDQYEEISAQHDEIATQRDSIHQQNEELKKQKQVITDSINYAQRIQQAILPSRNILTGHLSDHFIYYKPKDIVSGDFYWFTRKDEKLIIAAADCTGHGVPGAFMSMLGMAFLAEISRLEKVDSTAQFLEHLREKVKQSLRQYDKTALQKEGMDLALCIYDPDLGEMEFSGAYNSLYIVRKGELLMFKGDRQPVSVHPKEKPFTSNRITVEKDDVFYLFSDGYPDQVGGESRQKFRLNAFREMLLDIHQLSMDEQKAVLAKKLIDWMGDYPQIDDILVIGFKLM